MVGHPRWVVVTEVSIRSGRMLQLVRTEKERVQLKLLLVLLA